MAQQTMYPAKVNSPMAELSAGITSSATTIALVDASPLPAAPNLAVIGTAEDAETILYTGISGNSLTGVTRAFQGTAKAWSTGAKVARFFTAYDADTFRSNIQDLDSRVQVTENWYHGLTRQVLINGNFDIWQRATSVAANGTFLYVADRWCTFNNITNQASTISRQDGSGVVGSNYCLRYQRNAGQTGTNLIYLAQSLESTDSKKLVGKKLSLSFWSRIGSGSSMGNLSANIYSGTGTDQNTINGLTGNTTEASQAFTLTTTWQKFVLTTVSVISNNKTQIALQFNNTPSGTAGANDYFEIAQVQLNAGDQALPFQPRSFADELQLCQRYFEKSYNYADSPATNTTNGLIRQIMPSNTVANGQTYGTTFYKVKKRTTPTVILYSKSGTINRISDYNGTDAAANSGLVASTSNENQFAAYNGSGGSVATSSNEITYHWTADAEL